MERDRSDFEWEDRWDVESHFSQLKGETIKEIIGGKVGSEEIIFLLENGKATRLVYHHDCCASCSVEDICGELSDLIGSPILLAEEVSNEELTEAIKEIRAKEKSEAEAKGEYYSDHDSETWTFYKLATIKGAVTIRWYGQSNGYYSEEATFEWAKK